MGQAAFTLCTNQVITNANITGNGRCSCYTSSTITNPGNYPSLRVVLDYSNPLPLDGGAVAITYSIGAILESEKDGRWFPIAYQFEDFYNPDGGSRRILTLQPDIDSFDAGIDDIIYVAGATEARVSRQQGKVGSSFRLRIIINERGFGGAGAFQSVTLNAYGELYDAQ